MSFVHRLLDFPSLLMAVARETGVETALVEKDYWATHALWALHETGLDIWFKGGTSLSKGFGIIERFSEDLDLMVERGHVATLPEVGSWTSLNKGPVAERHAFYRALAEAFAIPAVPVEPDPTRPDRYGRGADYLGRYPGAFVASLLGAMRPSVRFEVDRARVVPFVARPVTSFVPDHLDRLGMLGEFTDNGRARCGACTRSSRCLRSWTRCHADTAAGPSRPTASCDTTRTPPGTYARYIGFRPPRCRRARSPPTCSRGGTSPRLQTPMTPRWC
jgi:hypothetical protein